MRCCPRLHQRLRPTHRSQKQISSLPAQRALLLLQWYLRGSLLIRRTRRGRHSRSSDSRAGGRDHSERCGNGEHIGGFDIAVHEPELMRCGQRINTRAHVLSSRQHTPVTHDTAPTHCNGHTRLVRVLQRLGGEESIPK